MNHAVAQLASLAGPLTGLYVAGCALNVAAAVYVVRRNSRRASAVGWLVAAGVFAVLAVMAWSGNPPEMPEGIKRACNAMLGPMSLSLGTLAALTVLYLGRRWIVRPGVAWAGMTVALLWFGLSMTDVRFATIATEPDHVAVLGMVALLAFFTWLGVYQAVQNDDRRERGEPPIEKDYDEKVFVWPDLVYVELICMVLVTAGLLAWSLWLPAPLQEPANPAVTPNPAKAPWYFLGLQEMLVFADAWYAGVVVPVLIILGLMAIPYLDPNPHGSGYYTIDQRPLAVKIFLLGFLWLWILPILVGTFFRGPNWAFLGLYTTTEPPAPDLSTNITLAEYFWTGLLGRAVPEVTGTGLVAMAQIVWREIAGLVVLGLYLFALPPLLGRTLLRTQRQQMCTGRWSVMVGLLLLMLSLPLKMMLRWAFDLNYVVSIPEWSLHF